MKIDILGRHPTLQPGFCGVMSLYEATYFAQMGHEARILIPFQSADAMQKVLAHRGVDTLDSLVPAGADFGIEPLFMDEPIPAMSGDVLVWQSTDATEWTTLYPAFRDHYRVITKNYPKTLRGLPAPLEKDVTNQFGAFDLVTFALKEDYHALWQYRDFAAPHQHRFIYVPRGADPDILHTGAKADHPVISIDMPNTPDTVAVEHFFAPLRTLKEEFPDLSVRTLGGHELEFDFAERLRFMPFRQMYDRFLNPAWLYCITDYSQSPAHIQGAIHARDRSWDARAIYEVQTVEAQMAGCIITGYAKNIIPELIDPALSATFDRFADEQTITDTMRRAILDQKSLCRHVRARAEHNFKWSDSIAMWESGLRNLTDNGYVRGGQTFVPVSDFEGPLSVQVNDRVRTKAGPVVAALKPGEKHLLFSLADQARSVVEFGCGGSTKIMSRSCAGHIYSFETDPDWIATLHTDPDLVEDLTRGRITLAHVDIGPTKEWGYPTEQNPVVQSRYAKAPWSQVPLEEVDLVLVDGRFRVVTALEAALRTEPHCLIAVDDYQDRPHYEALEEVLDIVCRAERLVVFAKGDKWERARGFAMAETYRLDPR